MLNRLIWLFIVLRNAFGGRGDVEYYVVGEGLIIFQFYRAESRDWVFANGLWHLGGKPILLCKWFPRIVP